MPSIADDLTPQPTEPVHTRWRRIVTPIPAPASCPLIERLRRAEPVAMSGLPPVLWHEAEGFLVRDACGNQWIDLTSGIMLANAGHAHPRVRAAIHEAADAKLLATYAFPSEARLRLLEALVAAAPMPDAKAILFSAGTEATECAMMLMRRHGRRLSPDKVAIVSYGGGFHGRTLAAVLAGGTADPTDWIQRARVGHHHVPYPFCVRCPWGRAGYESCGAACFDKCLEDLAGQGLGPERIAGVLVEPAPGWTTWPMPPDHAAALAAWARRHDVLIAFDEIQAGMGRCGRLFAGELLGITPDLITLGKGLSSSMPVSAVLGRRDLLDEPAPGEMSSTHGGNPICAAAALANLAVMRDEDLPGAAERTGALVRRALEAIRNDHPAHVRSIHGPGLFISIHVQDPHSGEPDIAGADAIAREAVRRGVLMFLTRRGFLKFTPPLCIDPEAALEAAEVLRACFRDVIGR